MMGKPSGDAHRGVVFYEDWQASADAVIHGLSYVGFVRALAVRSGRAIPPLDTRPFGAAVEAVVNHRRWLVDCPSGDGGAMIVSIDEALFWCLDCGNESNGRRWRRCVFPAGWERIMDLLGWRPSPANRNWRPGETIAMLEAENVAMGVRTE